MEFTRPAVSGKVNNSPLFHWARPEAVPIHRLPSEAPKSEITDGLGRCFPADGTKGTKRTPSKRNSPATVPIQTYPSVVWVIAVGVPGKVPSRKRQAVWAY